jgi:uncharacterized membrane protein
MRRWRGTLASTVEGYLAELRTALAGADPALVQDALYDAEEYLRSSSTEAGGTPEALAAAIDAYGSPEEVAEAYRQAEDTVAAALRKPRPAASRSAFGRSPIGRFFGVIVDPTAYAAMFYALLALVTGIIYFTVVTTGISLTLGLLILIIGIPIALLFIAMIRAISLAEGRIVEGLLGVRMPRRPRMAGVQGNLWERIKSWLADYRTWTTMLYMVLQLPLGIIYFTLMVTGLTTSVYLIASPIFQRVFHLPMFIDGSYGYYTHPAAYPLVMALGALGFFLTLWLAKGIGIVHGMWAKAMLVGRFDSAGPTSPASQSQNAQVYQ